MDIGLKIKELRISKGLTRKSFSELTGISPSYIEQIESSKKTPTIETLLKITSAFNLTVSELIGETKPNLTPELKTLLDNAKDLSPKQLEKLTEFIKSIK
ncbi:helix-turn-helix domain-containing protein [Clostridium senegalense]|uniref:helix-turn-helix domain-containing protein n=1 Tax=Clostridium senegalense TaxID=1465809 RepID=UPI001C103A5A|nr:helix-turn-helix transcriptional regulator [Clostridium senegalense]MBU5227807.1 helix-turn-helix domain-containing protein [Clostridium senegalense]